MTTLLGISLVASFNIHAEDSIATRNVNVERDYKPVIQDIGKINALPSILEPHIERTAPSYSEFNLPLSVDYNLHTLASSQPSKNRNKNDKAGYARIGIGNPLNTLADFAYPIISKSDSRLDFSFNHLGTYEKRTHAITKGALTFNKNFNAFDLYAGASAGHQYLKYYGNNLNDSASVINTRSLASSISEIFTEKSRSGLNQVPTTLDLNALWKDSMNSFVRLHAFAGFNSLSSAKILQYKLQLDYKLFSTQSDNREHFIHSVGRFSVPSGNNRIGLDMDMYNLVYQSNAPATINYQSAYSIFNLNPYYGMQGERWKVRLGAKSSFSIANGKVFSPSADINGEWKAVPKYLSLYGGITGGYVLNTMNETRAENPYILSEIRVEDTYTPFNAFAGIKIKPIYNLMLDGYLDYRKINNQYFFVNKGYSSTNILFPSLYTNRFDVIYSDASLFKLGMRANYNLQSWLNIQLKGSYNKWTVAKEQYAWNKPTWEGDFSTEMQLTKELQLSASAYFESGRMAKLGSNSRSINNKADINLGTSYRFYNWLSAFAKINNLLGNQNQYFYGYSVQGTNVLVGASFSF